MENVRKAFIMLSAAITMGAAGCQVAQAGDRPGKAPGKKKVQKTKKSKAKKRVKRVKRARKKRVEFSPELGMPAGTLYDVIRRQDIS